MTPGPALLGRLRDRLLDQVLGLLNADPVVEGVALIGSLGRGEADNWSDIDLLILMGDQALAQFVDAAAARPWAQADLLSDGRHNSPAGATSVGATHIRSGLPLWVDLHVHPAPRTGWPTDGRIVLERRPIEMGTLTFDQLNAGGSRQPATAKTAEEIRRIHLSYVPIAGKYIGRRSPRASDDSIHRQDARLQCLRPVSSATCPSKYRGRPVRPVLDVAKWRRHLISRSG